MYVFVVCLIKTVSPIRLTIFLLFFIGANQFKYANRELKTIWEFSPLALFRKEGGTREPEHTTIRLRQIRVTGVLLCPTSDSKNTRRRTSTQFCKFPESSATPPSLRKRARTRTSQILHCSSIRYSH